MSYSDMGPCQVLNVDDGTRIVLRSYDHPVWRWQWIRLQRGTPTHQMLFGVRVLPGKVDKISLTIGGDDGNEE